MDLNKQKRINQVKLLNSGLSERQTNSRNSFYFDLAKFLATVGLLMILRQLVGCLALEIDGSLFVDSVSF